MKVILVNGSPHKEGCTYTALKEVGTKAAELLKRQAENATRLEAAFRTLGVKL